MEEMTEQRMLKPIDLSTFLKEYKSLLEKDVIPKTETDIQNNMELSGDQKRFKVACDNCSLDQLSQEDDSRIVEFVPGQPEMLRIQPTDLPTEANNLRTLKSLINKKTNNRRNPFRRSHEIFKLAPFLNDGNESSSAKNVCAYQNDLLISVRIYRPKRATHIGRNLEKPVFAEQFQCLGSNFLTELRDKISCVCNKYHFYDISNDPDMPLPRKTTDPGFFFITDTFYDDKRNAQNVNYSETLLKWAKETSSFKNIEFKVAKMEETQFMDLTISLGFPQLYQHHGNCEHLFTFSQVELLTPTLTVNQIVSQDVFPRLHSFAVYNNRVCNMCGNVPYIFIVENSDRQLHDPSYLCNKCFNSFHYVDGKKIGNFRAYRIQDYTPAPIAIENITEEVNASVQKEIEDSNGKSTQSTLENFSIVFNENFELVAKRD